MDNLKKVKAIQALKQQFRETYKLFCSPDLSNYEINLLDKELQEMMFVINKYDRNFNNEFLGERKVKIVRFISGMQKFFTGRSYLEEKAESSKYNFEKNESKSTRVNKKDYEGTTQEFDFEKRSKERDQIYKDLLDSL